MSSDTVAKTFEIAFAYPELFGLPDQEEILVPLGKKIAKDVRKAIRNGKEYSGEPLPDNSFNVEQELVDTGKLVRSIAYHKKEGTVRPKSGGRADVGIRRGGNWALMYVLINGYRRDNKKIWPYKGMDPMGVSDIQQFQINELAEAHLERAIRERGLEWRVKAVGNSADLMAQIKAKMGL